MAEPKRDKQTVRVPQSGTDNQNAPAIDTEAPQAAEPQVELEPTIVPIPERTLQEMKRGSHTIARKHGHKAE